MKNNSLKFEPCYLVDSWATEMEVGKGVLVKGEYGNDAVIFVKSDDETFRFVHKSKCYWDLPSATKALGYARNSYLIFLQEQQKEREIKIKELSK